MAFDSFRHFVNALDRAGELKRISQPVATELEITEIGRPRNEIARRRQGAACSRNRRSTAWFRRFRWPSIRWVRIKRMAMSMGAESVEAAAGNWAR